LREEHRLRVFENRVLRRIFGLKTEEVTGEWRRLHNKELHALYSSPDVYLGDQIKINDMDRACSTYGGRRDAYRVLVGKREGRRPLGRPRRRWEDNKGWGHDLARDKDRWWAVVNSVMNLLVS
jgi:hypothetical protein